MRHAGRPGRRCDPCELPKAAPAIRGAAAFRAAGQAAEWKTMLPMPVHGSRSEEHTSELQSLMRISYAVFCLKKTTKLTTINHLPYAYTSSTLTLRMLPYDDHTTRK